jgi:hypothetical protein
LLAVAAVVLAAGVAPWVPPYGGVLGPTPALARAAGHSYASRAVLGLATVAAAAALASLFFGAHKLTRVLFRYKETGA